MVQSSFAHSPPTADALREAKRSLRERVLAARDSLSPEFRAAASAAICAALAARDDFAAASTVLLTLPFGSEWDSMALLLAALEGGKAVALPRVNATARTLELCPSELAFYEFSHVPDLDLLKADYRRALDQAGAFAPDQQAVVEEGAIAFSMNIDLSCAVEATLPRGSALVAAAE